MIAQELEVSLHMAFVEARQKRHEFITVEHLLLALDVVERRLRRPDLALEDVEEGRAQSGDSGVGVGVSSPGTSTASTASTAGTTSTTAGTT